MCIFFYLKKNRLAVSASASSCFPNGQTFQKSFSFTQVFGLKGVSDSCSVPAWHSYSPLKFFKVPLPLVKLQLFLQNYFYVKPQLLTKNLSMHFAFTVTLLNFVRYFTYVQMIQITVYFADLIKDITGPKCCTFRWCMCIPMDFINSYAQKSNCV